MIIRPMGRLVTLLLPLFVGACSMATAQGLPGEPWTHAASLKALRPVPPDGLDSLDESDFRYFQDMGPLEHAARLGGVPSTPAWRVRLRLYPQWQGDTLSYRVQMDHYNLSPALYGSLVGSYGIENVDPDLNNTTPHRHMSLDFMPVMNVSADWLQESTVISQSAVEINPSCGLGSGCASLIGSEIGSDSDRWSDEAMISMDGAPWDDDVQAIPMMVRALAVQAGWNQGRWTPPREIPEGIHAEQPWVEVLVTNYGGNGGGYVAHWIELGADDSIRAVLHRIFLNSMEPLGQEGIASRGYRCARGISAGRIQSICP